MALDEEIQGVDVGHGSIALALAAGPPVSVRGDAPASLGWSEQPDGWRARFDGFELRVVHLADTTRRRSTPAATGSSCRDASYRIEVTNTSAAPRPLPDLVPLDLRVDVGATARPAVRHMSGSWHYDAWFPPRAFRVSERRMMTHDHSKALVLGGANALVHSPLLQLALDEEGRLRGAAVGFEWSGGWELRAGWVAPSFRGEPRSPFGVTGHVAWGEVVVEPGATVALPPVHLVLFDAPAWSGADDVVRAHVDGHGPAPTAARPARPVSYNTWFGTTEDYDVSYQLAQVAAAAEIGCEYFCVDAAWYASGDRFTDGIGNWFTPDPAKWGERGLDDLRDAVRRAGMRFGLWIVPQAALPGTDAHRLRPELFRDSGARASLPEYQRRYGDADAGSGFPEIGAGLRLALEEPAAVDLLVDVLRRVVDRWDVDWLRVESLPEDGLAYNAGYDRSLDALRASHPHVYVEACNGGGQRLDLGAVARSDGNWLSDHTADLHVVRATQLGALRWWPARYLNAAVVADRHAPRDPTPAEVVSRMCGTLSFSGDIAAWSPRARATVRRQVDVHRSVRDVRGPLRFPLPQAPTVDDWEALHVVGPDVELLYAFRVDGPDTVEVELDDRGATAPRPWRFATGSDGAEVRVGAGTTLLALPRDGAGLWIRDGSGATRSGAGS